MINSGKSEIIDILISFDPRLKFNKAFAEALEIYVIGDDK